VTSLEPLRIEEELEVLVRQEDGHDLAVATLDPGAVFGERSLLTGEPRSATIRWVVSTLHD
jgi:CRP-like cAMP-binding protein